MHTEDEAKGTFCPIISMSNGEDMFFCITSSCMMWQWLDDEFEYLFSPPEQEGWTHVPYYSEGGTKCDRWGRKHQNRKGFCGLARR